MNTKIKYQWTKNEDMNISNNNYGCETETVILGENFDFGDFLKSQDSNVEFEQDGITFYILENGERTGEAYLIVSEEETEEETEEE